MAERAVLVIAKGSLRWGAGTSRDRRERLFELIQLCGTSKNATAIAVTDAARWQDFTTSSGRDCSDYLTGPVLEPATIREPGDPTHGGWADQLGLIAERLRELTPTPTKVFLIARLGEAEAFMARGSLRDEAWHFDHVQVGVAGGVSEAVGAWLADELGVPRTRTREGDHED